MKFRVEMHIPPLAEKECEVLFEVHHLFFTTETRSDNSVWIYSVRPTFLSAKMVVQDMAATLRKLNVKVWSYHIVKVEVDSRTHDSLGIL